MGVPELLKFVARSNPSALCRVPQTSAPTPQLVADYCFDYILIDATNVAQTIGFDLLLQFLARPVINIGRSAIFVLDSQRRRVGTAREQRIHNTTQDIELQVRLAAEKLNGHLQTKASSNSLASIAVSTCDDVDGLSLKKARAEACAPSVSVLLSGRDVAGEADYKMLHMQRALVTAHVANGLPIPKLLMISEDSDILCGALCGPAPQHVVVGTTLRDTTLDLCLLRLADVAAFLGQSADVLLYQSTSSDDSKQHSLNIQSEMPVQTKPILTPTAELVPAEPAAQEIDTDAEIRRKKKDGPMIATGTKLKLDDSSDDDEGPAAASSNTSADPKPHLQTHAPPATKGTEGTDSCGSASFVRPTASAVEVSSYLHHVCVDFVFLFSMVMGNTAGLPPLVRGATKVDMQTAWQVYCQKKYAADPLNPHTMLVRQLLKVSTGSKKHDFKAYVEVDTSFFSAVLQSLNYADPLSRPPVAEERERAVKYLQKAVAVAVQYTLACHVSGAPPLVVGDVHYRSYLDTRHDGEQDDLTPSLAALSAVLAAETSRTFVVPMRGEPLPTQSAAFSQAFQPEVDIDTTLTQLSGGASQRRSLQQLVPTAQWRTVAANVDSILKEEPLLSSMGLFERLDRAWSVLTATSIQSIQSLAQRIRAATKAVKGAAPKSVVAPPSASAPVAQTYSFELRRMAPIAATEAGTSSASKAALLRAAGLNFGYAVAKPHHENTMPSAEAQLKNPKQFGKPIQNAKPSEKRSDGEVPSAAKGKRKGKKERMKDREKRQQNAGASNSASNPPVNNNDVEEDDE